MVPKGWDLVRVGDALERVKRPVKVDLSQEYRQIGIRSHGKGIFHKQPVTGKVLGNKSVFWVQPNCFVCNIVFAWEQAIAVTKETEKGFIASHRFPMYRPINNRASVDYLLYLFKTKRGKHLLKLASPGGAGRNKTLGQSGFLNTLILLPSIQEQQKIVKVISCWDEAMSLSQALVEKKKLQKRALITSLLKDMKGSLSSDKEWEAVRFSDVLDIEIGGTPARSKVEFWDKKKDTNNRWLSIRDLKGNFVEDTSEYISDAGVRNSSVTLIAPETIVMSFKLTIGRKAILRKACYTNEAICALNIRNKYRLNNEFLFQALSSVNFDKEIDQAIKGKTLNKKKLGRLELKLPPINDQLRIASILSTADKEIDALQKKLMYFGQQKEVLLQYLFSGKKRVA